MPDCALPGAQRSSDLMPDADGRAPVPGTVTQAGSVLRQGEREKDRFLARIEAARTLRDFQRTGQDIAAPGRLAAGGSPRNLPQELP